MKELMMKMIVWFSRLPFIEKISANEFARGLAVGAIACLILAALLVVILWLIFREKVKTMVRVRGENGAVSVSIGAISSVLRHAIESELRCLDINRISLRSKNDAFAIVVNAKMDAAQGTVPQLMDKLNATVKSQMKTVFGITEIADIKLIIASCSGKADIPAEAVTEKPAKEENPAKDEKPAEKENNPAAEK